MATDKLKQVMNYLSLEFDYPVDEMSLIVLITNQFRFLVIVIICWTPAISRVFWKINSTHKNVTLPFPITPKIFYTSETVSHTFQLNLRHFHRIFPHSSTIFIQMNHSVVSRMEL